MWSPALCRHMNIFCRLAQVLSSGEALLCLQVEAVRLIAGGQAPRIKQPKEGATYECIQKKENAKVEEEWI